MKQLFSLILAGMVGGLVVFGAFKSTLTNNNITQEVNQSPQAVFTNGTAMPVDFVSASQIATPSVVHIEAEESEHLANQRYSERRRSPGSIFDFDLNDFFGGNFYGPKKGTGSGVIYSRDGYIVTNNHVVGFADDIKVTLTNGKEYKAVKVGTDPSSDLALLKIEGENLPPMPIGNSQDVKIGEWVLAVGNPFNLNSTVTAGIVSAKGRDLDLIEGQKTIEEFIQTDAAVNPGNSGGALVNTKGELIGINTAIATPTGVYAGYSFAIPVDLVVKIVEDIKVNGNIDRANLGIRGYDMDEELAKQENLNTTKGFYVVDVEDGSGAQFSGVLPGDVIVEVDGKDVIDIEDVKSAMKFSKVGDTITLVVLRDGKKKTLPVKLRKSL